MLSRSMSTFGMSLASVAGRKVNESTEGKAHKALSDSELAASEGRGAAACQTDMLRTGCRT